MKIFLSGMIKVWHGTIEVKILEDTERREKYKKMEADKQLFRYMFICEGWVWVEVVWAAATTH